MAARGTACLADGTEPLPGADGIARLDVRRAGEVHVHLAGAVRSGDDDVVAHRALESGPFDLAGLRGDQGGTASGEDVLALVTTATAEPVGVRRPVRVLAPERIYTASPAGARARSAAAAAGSTSSGWLGRERCVLLETLTSTRTGPGAASSGTMTVS